MSLHGPIEVNRLEIGYWSAQRVETGSDGINTYRCQVDWTPEGFVRRSTGMRYPYRDKLGRIHHAQRHTFTLRHDYRDGAVALAAKVLSECMATPDPALARDPLEDKVRALVAAWDREAEVPTFDHLDQCVARTYAARANDLRALLPDAATEGGA